MKIEFILFILKILYSFQINPFLLTNFYLLNNQYKYMPMPELRNKTIKLFSLIIKHIDEIHNNTNFTEELDEMFPLDEEYLNLIKEIYLVDVNETISERIEYFYLKTFLDTSKNKYDLTTYDSCVKRKFLYNLSNVLNENIRDTLYYMITIDATNIKKITKISYENYYYNFGVCFPNLKNSNLNEKDNKNWAEKNFKNLFIRFNHMFNNFSSLYYDINAINQIKVVTIYNNTIQNKLFNEDIKTIKFWFGFLILLMLIILLMVNNIIFRFDICKKKKNNVNIASTDSNKSLLNEEEEDEDDDDNNNNKNNYSTFKKLKYCFNLHSNFNELFKFNNKYSTFNNEKGIDYIKGLRGISIFFLIFGMLTMMLYNSECSQIGISSLKNYYTSYFYPIFFIGIRYSPRVLFSCSGFSLIYKLLCFLDNRNEKIKEENNNIETKDIKTNDNNTNDNNNNITNSELDNNNESKSNDYFKTNDISLGWYGLLEFYYKQSHKYIIFIYTLLFLRYSLYNFIRWINIKFYNGNGPLWENFGEIINESSFPDFVLSLFCILPFRYEEGKNFLIYLWPVYNEFLFFFLSSAIIFLCYKYKYRIDIIFYIIIIINFILKLVFFFINLSDKFRYTNLYIYLNNFGYISIHPLYNYVYYVIGMCFGMFQYIILKGLDNNIEGKKINKEKPYLKSFIKLMNYIQCLNDYLYIIKKYYIILIIILAQPILPLIFNYIIFLNKENTNLYNNNFYNIFLLFDIEYEIICLFILSFIYYTNSLNDIINKFLTHNIWSIGNKLYLTLIMQINLITLYIFYQSESSIIFNPYNCILYSFLTSFIAFISSCFVYIVIELPFKKYIIINENNFEEVEKFFLYEKEKKKKK